MKVELSFSHVVPPIYDGENYDLWTVKIELYLETLDLWETVEEEYDVLSLPGNLTMIQIKYHKENKAHKEARQFRFKVIANWDDIVDLGAKDRATGHGAETAIDIDEIMSRELNEGELGLEGDSDTIYLDESSSITQRRGQSSASTSTQS
uniref:DUF4219 domain-containing protein n=1 Tax=Cajanus cajan TaxID=3821 RepID=A0A151SU78_CAJCA|nr:hypothetical protein KK1_004618 [Cajanus cajan]